MKECFFLCSCACMIMVGKKVPPHFWVFPKVMKLWGQNDVLFIPIGASPSRDNPEGVDGFYVLSLFILFYYFVRKCSIFL